MESGRVDTLVKRMEGPEFCGFYVYVFGSTHASDIPSIPKKLNGAVKLLRHGSCIKGWRKIVPIPKPQSFAFSISDTSRISDLFKLLDFFLLITFIFSSADGAEGIERLLKSGVPNLCVLENEAVAPYVICTFDLDSGEVESGMLENLIISDDFFDEIRSILWI